MGTGCARGFLAAFDTAWMVRGWAQGKSSLEILAERESIYRLLPQTTPENISKNFEQYTIDPATRYPNLNSSCVRPHQVRHLFIDGQSGLVEKGGLSRRPVNLPRKESEVRPSRLLTWCQNQTRGYRGVDVTNLTSSWRDGLALCALIHRQRPELVDFDSLNEEDAARNNQLAFDVAEREFGIQPVTTGKEMAARAEPDKLLMVLYLSKFFEAFRKSSLNNNVPKESDENGEEYPPKSNHKVLNLPQPRKRTPRDEKKAEDDSVNKRRRKGSGYLAELSCHNAPPAGEDGELRENKVRSMATQLLAKFEENSSTAKVHTKCVVRKDFPPGLGGSDICHFCSKRVYVMERLSAEGYFFHRECFRCDVCNCTLRLGGHTFDSQERKFYCKIHYAQRQYSTSWGRFRRTTENLSHLNPSSVDSGICSATGAVQPAGEATSMQSDQLKKDPKTFPKDTEMGVDALEASCIIGPKKGEGAAARSHDGLKGHSNTKHNNRWKRKIRATFPLIFIKHFRSKPETVPEVDSDIEEITSAETRSEPKPKADAQTLSEESKKSDEPLAATKSGSSTSAPNRRRLLLSQPEKERLLNWEEGPNAEETPINSSTTNTSQLKDQVQAEADKPPSNSSQIGTASRCQTPASSSSAIQVIANAFRRTFSGSSEPSSSKAAVIMRPKRNVARKQRPMSEGASDFSSLFGRENSGSSTAERRTSMRGDQWASVGTDPWGEGRDLPSLLQQVSLKSRRDSEGVPDELRSMSRKRVDLFSSLRLRKRGQSESEGKEQEAQKEIRTFLSNLKNKDSSKQSLEELSSSGDESESLTSTNKLSSDRLKKKQEKTAAQQAKREQLKRLHRAQIIQRQLEEVEEKQRDLEEKGVRIEKIIRGEDSHQTDDRDEAQLYQAWFELVLEKNRLARYESELMIFAQSLALEDTQSRLQQDLRRRMSVEDTNKSASELQKEMEILAEIMRTVEKRDMLVSILEEQRLKEMAEDKDLESLMLSRGYEFHWAQGGDTWGKEKLE